jgi:hypothetical protein
MLVLVGSGVLCVIVGAGSLIGDPGSKDWILLPIGVVLILAPFVWLNWASEQSLKRRHDPSRKKSFWEG